MTSMNAPNSASRGSWSSPADGRPAKSSGAHLSSSLCGDGSPAFRCRSIGPSSSRRIGFSYVMARVIDNWSGLWGLLT
jgi:hypothetical protein